MRGINWNFIEDEMPELDEDGLSKPLLMSDGENIAFGYYDFRSRQWAVNYIIKNCTYSESGTEKWIYTEDLNS